MKTNSTANLRVKMIEKSHWNAFLMKELVRFMIVVAWNYSVESGKSENSKQVKKNKSW